MESEDISEEVQCSPRARLPNTQRRRMNDLEDAHSRKTRSISGSIDNLRPAVCAENDPRTAECAESVKSLWEGLSEDVLSAIRLALCHVFHQWHRVVHNSLRLKLAQRNNRVKTTAIPMNRIYNLPFRIPLIIEMKFDILHVFPLLRCHKKWRIDCRMVCED